ncbi:DNA-methyltransferase [Symbiobacterium terraclitae]|uniref:DNA-methyltransferase n=1 Tax=Symbiobacterium terraclitae TaxID=557451 RepID=UPI0035B5639F
MATDYANRIVCGDSRDLSWIPDGVVSLTVTSPMYWGAGMEYDMADDCMPLRDYIDLHRAVWSECYRVTEPGGRIAVVVANVGRKPYRRLTDLHAGLLHKAGWILKGEVIWDKGPVYGTAWGSWRRPTAPEIRDRHEYILIAQKPGQKPNRGPGEITATEFTEATQSVWPIRPAIATKVGHPAPFPLELPIRLIKLYTYRGDLVLDPFNGIGTTCHAAAMTGRRWIGVDISPTYCEMARRSLDAMREAVGCGGG